MWKTIERPGYLGKARDAVYAQWDKEYGQGNWRIAYKWVGNVIERDIGLQIYEDGYYNYLYSDEGINILDWITKTASDVYDTAPSNAGQLDYIRQETPNNHIHDVAIRRSVLRLGYLFKGDHLVHVRGSDSEGYRLCPGIVPFHIPGLIMDKNIKDYSGRNFWWRDNSIEDFYQRNKILQVKE
jgi:hypothetical protein